jgi:hypothetical protein
MSYGINEGTAKTVAADVVGSAAAPSSGQHVTWVGLAPGTAGALAPAARLNPVPVGQAVELIQVTPTLDTSAYASGDLICDVTTITGAASLSGGYCELVSVTIVDQDDQTASAYTIYVTNLSTSWGTFNTAPAPADATALGIQAIIQIAAADWQDLVAFKVAQPVATPFTPKICKTSGSANLYMTIVNGAGTPTFTASGIKVTFGFRQVGA